MISPLFGLLWTIIKKYIKKFVWNVVLFQEEKTIHLVEWDPEVKFFTLTLDEVLVNSGFALGEGVTTDWFLNSGKCSVFK